MRSDLSAFSPFSCRSLNRLLCLFAVAAIPLQPAHADGEDAVGYFLFANHPIPDRPAIPIVHMDGKRVPVVDIRSLRPRVIVNGREETVSGPISLVPGDIYHPGLVKVVLVKGTTGMNQQVPGTSEADEDATRFRAQLTSDTDLDKVFVVIPVFEDPTKVRDEALRMDTFGTAVGKLKAGKSEWIDVTINQFGMGDVLNLKWTVLVFSGGIQVRTTPEDGLLDYLFNEMDHRQFDQVIQERAFGTHPLAAFRRLPFHFKKELNERYAGRTMNITVGVSVDGVPEIISMDGEKDPEFVTAVKQQLGMWLLLPAIRDGRVLATRVVIPIQFPK